jgi:bacterioferritin (cytochrome b1)
VAVTKNGVTKDMLVSELQNLLRLTAFEQTIATVRRAQAASTPIAEELRANAQKSVERSRLLQDAVRQVGGVPDVVGATLGRAGALVQTQVNQVQTLQGALLGDLALEHQLRERTRYARTLAESLGYHQVLPVLDRLETAHTATIEWLETRLEEVGRTGTSALRATPVQTAVGTFRKVAGAPFAVFAASVNRGSSLLNRGAKVAAGTAEGVARTAAGTAEDVARTAAGTAQDVTRTATKAAGDAASSAADGVSQAAQTVAGTTAQGVQAAGDAVSQAAETTADVAADAAQSADQQVIDLTDVDEQKPPFAGYETLSGDSVMRHVRDSDDVEHLREILAFEQAHKARKGVLGALQERLGEVTGASTSA